MADGSWLSPKGVSASRACADCCGTGDAGPWYTTTDGDSLRFACRRCRGTGLRRARDRERCGYRSRLSEALAFVFLLGLLGFAWVVMP